MPTAKKRTAVKELQELFTSSQVLIFTNPRGLSVSEITNLRRQLREKGVEYHVTKNTLTRLAADRAGLTEMHSLLDGPIAIAFVGDDIPGAAKVLTDFVRTSRILQIQGGLMGHVVIGPDQVGDLTKLLTREQYIAKVMGSMQAPISGMVGALAGVIRNFMNVMQARVDQLKEQGEPEAPALEAPAAPSTNGAAPEASLAATAPVVSAEEVATPAASVEDATPAASTEDATPAASVEDATPAATVEDSAPTASVEEAAPAVSVEDAAPAASVEEATPAASVEDSSPAAPTSVEEPTPVASVAEAAAPAEAVAEAPAELPAEDASTATPTGGDTTAAGEGEEGA
jgi:large subunit ribosomal protein L10